MPGDILREALLQAHAERETVLLTRADLRDDVFAQFRTTAQLRLGEGLYVVTWMDTLSKELRGNLITLRKGTNPGVPGRVLRVLGKNVRLLTARSAPPEADEVPVYSSMLWLVDPARCTGADKVIGMAWRK